MWRSLFFLCWVMVIVSACSTSNGIKQSPNSTSDAAIRLSADGVNASYLLIEKTLLSSAETPDCGHQDFGPHITEVIDQQLGHWVFAFHLHVRADSDRCRATDRQRVEIKTFPGFMGDTMTYRWRFRLPLGFQVSHSFTHLHQLKAVDGDDEMPLITLTARKGTPNVLQLIHIDTLGETHILNTDTALLPLLGQWLEVHEKVRLGEKGSIELKIIRVDDGKVVFDYSRSSLDLWRKGTTGVRPKWGIYRSLKYSEVLRDEEVRFDAFCLAKGEQGC